MSRYFLNISRWSLKTLFSFKNLHGPLHHYLCGMPHPPKFSYWWIPYGYLLFLYLYQIIYMPIFGALACMVWISLVYAQSRYNQLHCNLKDLTQLLDQSSWKEYHSGYNLAEQGPWFSAHNSVSVFYNSD